MAKPSTELIAALRATAERLRNGVHYSWGHHGACNCGNLFQVITSMTEGEILRCAQTGMGEWTELSEEYCPDTNASLSFIMTQLEHAGLTPVDVRHIEYLTDRTVLLELPGGFRWLKRNLRQDVILYFETFANLLEDQLIASVDIEIDDIICKKPQFVLC